MLYQIRTITLWLGTKQTRRARAYDLSLSRGDDNLLVTEQFTGKTNTLILITSSARMFCVYHTRLYTVCRQKSQVTAWDKCGSTATPVPTDILTTTSTIGSIFQIETMGLSFSCRSFVFAFVSIFLKFRIGLNFRCWNHCSITSFSQTLCTLYLTLLTL